MYLLVSSASEPLCSSRLLAAIILDIVYGIEINDMKDEYVKTLVEALEILGESKKPGKYWVDFIPLLQYVPAWVPGAASAKFAAHSRPVVEKMLHKPFDDVKKGGSEKVCQMPACSWLFC